MKIDVSDGFADEVKLLTSQFDTAARALQKGDFSTLTRALTVIVRVATVLLTVLGALNQAKAPKGGR